jgi:hypothetical protein|uniref:DM13 domain-containing protein n=1 Tax=Mariniflexile sp. TaxID=1979402 RepID=UPI004048222A
MKTGTKAILLAGTHAIVLAIGFAGGIYTLPILIAPPPPSAAEVQVAADEAVYSASFRRDLAGSDALHWGEGTVTLGPKAITLAGRLAPGPDYKLYLSPQFVETETDFVRLKSSMTLVGDVRTFENFIVPVDAGTDYARYNTVIIWCESFEEFITAARYR